jgi:hypothetical protein
VPFIVSRALNKETMKAYRETLKHELAKSSGTNCALYVSRQPTLAATGGVREYKRSREVAFHDNQSTAWLYLPEAITNERGHRYDKW